VGVAAYFFREPLQDALMTPFGLGVFPLAVWVAVVLWAAASRRSWLRRITLWMGSLALVALSMGIMAFFEAGGGILGEFTLDGEVSLGGEVGEAIIGSAGWLGVLRLIGVLVVAVGLAAPPLAADVLASIGKVALFAYFGLVMGTKSLGRMYKTDRRPRPEERGAATERGTGVPPTGTRRSTFSRSSSVPGADVSATIDPYPARLNPSQAEGPVAALPSAPYRPVTTEEEPAGDRLEAEKPAPEAPAAPEPDGGLPVIGKFNRLWTSSEDGPPADTATAYVEEAIHEEAAERPPSVSSWSLPTYSLLEDVPEADVSETDLNETAETIRRTLAEYGVEVEIGHTRPGPTVTMYGLIPGWVRRYKQVKQTDENGLPKLDESGKQVVTRVEEKTRVKVDSILSREKDLSLALKTSSIRIETPVMGEAQVGIEVPNPNPSLVTLRSVMESKAFVELRKKADLPVALGKGTGGETLVIDLAKMPHLLIAGATGSGKSVCLNTIVSCLVMEKTPAELRLLLIDPKRVELTPYNGIPHLITPVVVETDQVVGLLKGMIHEMLERYRRMEEAAVRNIAAYNRKMPDKMPFLVVAVDELADLMMSAAFDVEQSLCRLAQLGRATGIHLIVATQRPSVDVVTGLIKANFPSRISFGVTSQVDSRTILDTAGADKLLGRGDMLYLPLDASKPVRAQNVFISDREIGSLVDFWKSTPRGPAPSINLRPKEGTSESSEGAGPDANQRDEFLDKAIELAHRYNKISTSLLQRRLRIGYPRAARLMDELEEQAIIGPSDGSKSRDVIIS
jgi:S-DNA-T family DNA segregation ATPase FtsK/SpoIIIE